MSSVGSSASCASGGCVSDAGCDEGCHCLVLPPAIVSGLLLLARSKLTCYYLTAFHQVLHPELVDLNGVIALSLKWSGMR